MSHIIACSADSGFLAASESSLTFRGFAAGNAGERGLCRPESAVLFASSSVREPQHLLLTRPCDRCIEEAGDTDSARQPTIDSLFDEAWREEGQ
jgi:hypothetical protein